MSSFKIGECLIGADAPTFIIAEMSGNHNRSLDRALELVDVEAVPAVGGLSAHQLLVQRQEGRLAQRRDEVPPSTGHTEAIVTTELAAAQRFTEQVDAAAVMVNASTAFTDGEQFGFGAEIGISTQKLHARGPMALPELTTTKWIVEGDGQIR